MFPHRCILSAVRELEKGFGDVTDDDYGYILIPYMVA
jgi:hypothetical protein